MAAEELYDDRTLFASIAEGDEKAFGIFFHKYHLKIYTFILRSVRWEGQAEELTHDVLLSVWTQQTKLAAVENPQAYLFSIVYHKIYSCLRQQVREKRRLQQLPADGVSRVTQETLDANESRQLIEQAIQQLPPQRKKIYLLRHQEGMSYEDIARHMQISPNTVKNQLGEALKSIRRHVKGSGLLLAILQHWL